MEIEEMHLAGGSSKIKAYFDLLTEEGITVKGFKITEGPNGLFVGMPSEQDRNNKGKYWDRVTMSRELRDELLQLALVEYKKLAGGSNSTQGAASSPKSAPF